MRTFLYWIPLLPLLGFLFNFVVGVRVLGRRGHGGDHGHGHGHGEAAHPAPSPVVGLVACATVALSFVVSVMAVLQARSAPGHTLVETLWPWIPGGALETAAGARPFGVDWAYMVDPLSSVMLLVVTFVGFLIHVYSVGYMSHDPGYARYMSYLNLFMFAMLTLVLGANYLVLFVGWEGVGLCSYLLIGFWFDKKSASDAGKKAFIVNRIGDAGFALGMFLIFFTFGSLDFRAVMAAAAHMPVEHAWGGTLTVIGLLLFVGACGKSAQIPLYVWLPDAMEGPTPVSALIHAATMVTAGVYMVARSAAIYSHAANAMMVVAFVGAATAILAASIGLVQNDIKRVLAYSTVSQLGYMFLACGVGAYSAGVFHLMTHAFFKALLFLGAGSVIHALSGEQDMRHMGGLKRHLPWTHGTMLIACLAIAGIPPFAGFFSKDMILEADYESHWRFLYVIGLITAGLTAFYMFRLFFLTFYGEERLTPEARHHLHESPRSMTGPLTVLAFFSAVAGFVGLPLVTHGNRFGEWLAPVFADVHAVREMAAHAPALAFANSVALEEGGSAALEIVLMVVSVGAALVGIWVARSFYLRDTGAPQRWGERFQALYRTFFHKYWVDELYQATIVRPLERLSQWLWRFFDVGVIDGVVDGTGGLVVLGGTILRLFQNGYVGTYAFFIVLGVVLVLFGVGAGR
jgi:NADH-quinone oxidoreductase subunit L